MDKIRIGNDIHIEWSIFRDNQPEEFEGKDVEVRLIHTRTRDVIPLEWVISDGVVSATFYGKDQIDTGDYKLMLVENNGAPNMATIDECKAFTLVQCSCQEQKEDPSTSLQLHKVQLTSSFALSGGGNISVEGYPNVDELEEVKELSGNENIIITDSEGNKKTTIGNLKEYVVKDISELPPFRIFETESDYNAVKDELGDCVVCLRDTGVMLYHVYNKTEEGGGEIEDKYIRFADPEVQRICADNWGDGVGITKAQVESVTTFAYTFQGSTIKNFDDAYKFNNVTKLEVSGGGYGGAFNRCTSLTSITLPTSITEIQSGAPTYGGGDGAFFDATSLVRCLGLGNVSYFGACSFYKCPSLTEVDIDWNKVTYIGEAAFTQCKINVDKLAIPKLETLGGSSLQGIQTKVVADLGKITSLPNHWYSKLFCDNVECVVLPDTLTSMDTHSMYMDSGFNTLVMKAVTPPTIQSNTFMQLPSSAVFYVPDASVEAYKGATNWSDYASRIKGISELPTDNAELYNEIKDYLS